MMFHEGFFYRGLKAVLEGFLLGLVGLNGHPDCGN